MSTGELLEVKGKAPNETNHFQMRNSDIPTETFHVYLVMAGLMDCELFAQLFRLDPRLKLDASADLDYAFACCLRYRPEVVIVDPKCHADAVARTVDLVIQGHAASAILFDDRLCEGLVAAILPFHQISYLTRHLKGQALVDATLHIARTKERVFDPAISDRVLRTSRGWRLRTDEGQPGLAGLTHRERQVLVLLARGKSVRDCAEQLCVSQSTIDNHKTRLMKKLRVHKATELVHLAIRDGLIHV